MRTIRERGCARLLSGAVCFTLLAGGLFAGGDAGTASNAAPASTAMTGGTHKLEGIFDTDLPKTEHPGTLRLIVHPHFGDFTRRSYVRIPTGVRWGMDEFTEINGTVEPYFQHGLKSGDSGNGIGDLQFGFKRRLPNLVRDLETSVGLNTFFPVG